MNDDDSFMPTEGFWFDPMFVNGEMVTIPLLNATAKAYPENYDRPVWIGSIGYNLSADFWENHGGKYGTKNRGYPTYFPSLQNANSQTGLYGGIAINLKNIAAPDGVQNPTDRWHNIKTFPDLKVTHDGFLIKNQKVAKVLEWFLGKEIYEKPFIEKEIK